MMTRPLRVNGRWVKSPAARRWAESSGGGFGGPEIRCAGYGGIGFAGRAASPVYLWLDGGKAELRDACYWWGPAEAYETQARITSTVAVVGAPLEGRITDEAQP